MGRLEGTVYHSEPRREVSTGLFGSMASGSSQPYPGAKVSKHENRVLVLEWLWLERGPVERPDTQLSCLQLSQGKERAIASAVMDVFLSLWLPSLSFSSCGEVEEAALLVVGRAASS